VVLTYLLNDFEMVPVAPIITGITLVFTFHICCISIVRSLLTYLLTYLLTPWSRVPLEKLTSLRS
jgi:hypothetical protein